MPNYSSVAEAFAAMKELDPAQTAGMSGSIQFDLSGEGGGQWAIKLGDGSFEIVEGGVESPTTTISMSAEDYVKMMNGELNAMAAFMQGKIKVSGDMGLAMKLQSLTG
jgi:putative sterol carrier protein